MPSEVSLRDASAEWRRRHSFPDKSASEVLEELLTAKATAGVSAVYLKDLSRLRKFADAFRCSLLSIDSVQVERFLLSLGMTSRTRNNYRRNINTLFNFARRRGYLPRDHDVMSGVEKARGEEGEIEVFTPDELDKLLKAARPEMIPYLAIAGFAGLRAAELQRLDWSEVHLAERHIELKAAKAKTASRRIVPITENLAAWLAPYVRPFGPVTPFANMSKQLTETLSPAAGVKWKHNGLRHSFISYRLAIIKDTAQVALEAGNSPNMIFKHYRKLVTEREAQRWFELRPVGETNVIALPQEVVG